MSVKMVTTRRKYNRREVTEYRHRVLMRRLTREAKLTHIYYTSCQICLAQWTRDQAEITRLRTAFGVTS